MGCVHSQGKRIPPGCEHEEARTSKNLSTTEAKAQGGWGKAQDQAAVKQGHVRGSANSCLLCSLPAPFPCASLGVEPRFLSLPHTLFPDNLASLTFNHHTQAEDAGSGPPGSRLSGSHLPVFLRGCGHVSNSAVERPWSALRLGSATSSLRTLASPWTSASQVLGRLPSHPPTSRPLCLLSPTSARHTPASLSPSENSASTPVSFQSILLRSWNDHIIPSWKLFWDFPQFLAFMVSSSV